MAKKVETTTVKVRILTDCHAGKCGEVLELPTAVAADLIAVGFADSNPQAVAYAESQR